MDLPRGAEIWRSRRAGGGGGRVERKENRGRGATGMRGGEESYAQARYKRKRSGGGRSTDRSVLTRVINVDHGEFQSSREEEKEMPIF